MLCYFLLYNKMNQLYVYIYPHIPYLMYPSNPVSEAHQGTVDRKVLRLNGLQLVQHFADNDHTRPHSADA